MQCFLALNGGLFFGFFCLTISIIGLCLGLLTCRFSDAYFVQNKMKAVHNETHLNGSTIEYGRMA